MGIITEVSTAGSKISKTRWHPNFGIGICISQHIRRRTKSIKLAADKLKSLDYLSVCVHCSPAVGHYIQKVGGYIVSACELYFIGIIYIITVGEVNKHTGIPVFVSELLI